MPKRKPYVSALAAVAICVLQKVLHKACKQLRIVARAYSVCDIRVQAYSAPVLGHIVLADLAHKLRHVALGKGIALSALLEPRKAQQMVYE